MNNPRDDRQTKPYIQPKWRLLAKKKPEEKKIYPVWCFDALWLDWNGDSFVDKYGIVRDVTHWMDIDGR